MESLADLCATELIRQCPSFRLLVLGKSGAGKSTAINEAFKVNLANVSHWEPGKSDIEQEIRSPTNPLFVLHDSQGFETGETSHFKTVKNFIDRRSSLPNLKDKLHAIWLCVEIPTSGGRVFEDADEEFLRTSYGNVPVIIVFTKYDRLVDRERKRLEEEDPDALKWTDDEVEEMALRDASVAFQDICVAAYEALNLPSFVKHAYTHTSVEDKESFANLVSITENNLSEALCLMLAFAQRANADINVAASIKVGKKRYWKGIFTNAMAGNTLEKCLDNIRDEIVTVWNLRDEGNYLQGMQFKRFLEANLLESHLYDSKKASVGTHGLKIAAATAAILAAAVPAHVIVVPVVVSAVVVALLHQVYTRTPKTVRVMMGYTVDLIIIMQSCFWIMHAQGPAATVPKGLVELAFLAYSESDIKDEVHYEITQFIADRPTVTLAAKDHALNKMVELIQKYRFVPGEAYKTKDRFEIAQTMSLEVETENDSETNVVG